MYYYKNKEKSWSRDRLRDWNMVQTVNYSEQKKG